MRRKSSLKKRLIHPMTETYHDYLIDESNMMGAAESISFPETEAEIHQILRVLQENQTPVTIQGGKTGIAGSAVPLRGHIMNLSNMKRVKSFCTREDGSALLTVEPGVTLVELRKAIERIKTPKALCWPPESSESTATVGGVASTGAKGICSRIYGDTKSYVDGIRVMNAADSIDDIKKGQSAVFIHAKPKDLLDVYLGGEGMYGVITELILRLIPKPAEIWGIGFFFEDQADGFSFVDKLEDAARDVEGAQIAAIEYLDRVTVDAIETYKQYLPKLTAIPDIAPHTSSMVYVEIHGERQEPIDTIAETLMCVGMNVGSDPNKTWAFSGEHEIKKMRSFLHATIETAILHIAKVRLEDPRITRLGIDLSLENEGLKTVVRHFETYLREENLSGNLFGHVGDNTLHLNILPKNYEDYVKGKALLEKWAEKFTAFGGNAIKAYGIGKLKKSIFLKAASKACIEEIIQLKKQLDKNNLWNPGNMIDLY
jgi:D-lactate dehydrogenase (cytochrome)